MSLLQVQESIHEEILSRLDLNEAPTDEQLQELIHDAIKQHSQQQYIPIRERMILGRDLFSSFRKLDLLQDLIDDRTITEIMVNGPDRIFIEQDGRLFQTDKRFASLQKLEDVVQQIAAASNRIVNEYSPIADARLEDGSRVNLVLSPAALNGPIITIRKFPEHPMTMQELCAKGALTQEASDFLKLLVCSKYNIFISGGTGAGKTTFLNALSAFIPQDERIITIEDNAELQLLDKPNLVRLEARSRNTEGKGEISIRDLIRTALRMRPDRIIVGEVRSAEALDMLQAMNTGHDGSLSTGHANSPADMIARLSTMVLMGMDLPLAAVMRQLASGLDLIIHLGRLADKSRKVLEIAEVDRIVDGEVSLNVLFKYEEGHLRRVGSLKATRKLEQAGYDLKRL